MKICTRCLVEKPLDTFYLHKGKRTSPGYRNPKCKTCHAVSSRQWGKDNPEKLKIIRQRTKLKKKYKVDSEYLQKQTEIQQGACYLCKKVPSRNRALNVDHNHKTGEVRKLLCDKCNMALGLVNDDPSSLQEMINYLNENSTI